MTIVSTIAPMTRISIGSMTESRVAMSVSISRSWLAAARSSISSIWPLASPLFADLTSLPPLLVQVGTAEVLLDDSTRFATRARQAGIDIELEVWDDMIHDWHAIALVLPEGRQAIERVGEFVKDALR